MSLEDRVEELRRRTRPPSWAGARSGSSGSTARQEDRARADRGAVDKGSFAEVDRLVVHQSRRLRDGRPAHSRRRGGHRLGAHPWAAGVRVTPRTSPCFGGSYRRRMPGDLQDHGLRPEAGVPIIDLNDSGVPASREGVVSWTATADIFLPQHLASGVRAPDLRDHGTLRGGGGCTRGHHGLRLHGEALLVMFVKGPDVIKPSPHEEVSFEELGGARPTGGVSASPTSRPRTRTSAWP